MTLVRTLFPPDVHVAEMNPREADVAQLMPEEAAMVARAVEKRRQEFAAGRILARRLFGTLGVASDVPLLNGDDRAPIWPEGLIGTITHTRHWAAVAIARDAEVLSLGCDVEADEPLQPKLFRIVCTPAERAWLDTLPEAERGRWAKLIFSAKESVYKTQFPLTRTFLGFHAAEIAVERETRRFRATLQTEAGVRFREGDVLEGCFRMDGTLIGTAITLRF